MFLISQWGKGPIIWPLSVWPYLCPLHTSLITTPECYYEFLWKSICNFSQLKKHTTQKSIICDCVCRCSGFTKVGNLVGEIEFHNSSHYTKFCWMYYIYILYFINACTGTFTCLPFCTCFTCGYFRHVHVIGNSFSRPLSDPQWINNHNYWKVSPIFLKKNSKRKKQWKLKKSPTI